MTSGSLIHSLLGGCNFPFLLKSYSIHTYVKVQLFVYMYVRIWVYIHIFLIKKFIMHCFPIVAFLLLVISALKSRTRSIIKNNPLSLAWWFLYHRWWISTCWLNALIWLVSFISMTFEICTFPWNYSCCKWNNSGMIREKTVMGCRLLIPAL